MKVPDTNENVDICVCPGCPSFDDCMSEGIEALYCSRGKSDCAITEQGCICDGCPVQSDYGLSSLYYCENGVEE